MSPIRRNQRAHQRRRMIAMTVATSFASAACAAASLYQTAGDRRPYHTSLLSGPAWIRELLLGNHNRIRENLGLGRHAFRRLVTALEQKTGLCDSRRGVTTNEQVAIFLYTVTTGLTIRKVAEQFQRSASTISR